MKKLWFLLMQLFPLMYVSEYRTNDHREVAVWRQWFGRPFQIQSWTTLP